MIPDFLKRENRKNPSKYDIKVKEAIERYEKHFSDSSLMTEAWCIPYENWVEVLNYCVAQNKTIWELTGEKYNPEEDY